LATSSPDPSLDAIRLANTSRLETIRAEPQSVGNRRRRLTKNLARA
jgi:hypothetical protein